MDNIQLMINNNIRYREEHRASVVLSWFTLWYFFLFRENRL